MLTRTPRRVILSFLSRASNSARDENLCEMTLKRREAAGILEGGALQPANAWVDTFLAANPAYRASLRTRGAPWL